MALVIKDRVRQTSTTAGTGTITLSGSVSGYQDFSVIGTSNTTYYTIADQSGSNWEVGLGTYTSPNQLSRDTVYESSNANALVNFGSNIKDVFVTLPAEGVTSGTVTSVTAISPVASTGGTTPVISMPAATASVSGYLTSTDWNTFNNKQPAGAYLTSVTSDSPLTGSGTSASHLSIPAASSTVSGYLTSTDWSTFNSKAPATSGTSLLYGDGSGGFSNVTIGSGVSFVAGTLSATGSGGTITGSGTTNYVPKFSSSTALSDSLIYDDGTNVGIGTPTPTTKLDVNGGISGTTVTANTIINLPAITNIGSTVGKLEMVDGGDGYDYLNIWTDENGTQYPVTFPAGLNSPSLAALSLTALSDGTNSGEVRIYDSASLSVTVTVPTTLSSVYILQLPSTAGSANQVLKTDGTGVTSWVTQGVQGTAPVTVTTATYTVTATDQWIIGDRTGTITLTLPTASTSTGRSLNIKTIQAQTVVSASSNVVPLNGGAAGTAILTATIGKYATLVSNGTNWIIMGAN